MRKQANYIENFKVKDSLVEILSLAKARNIYLSSHEPWNVIKKDRKSASTTLYVSIQIVNALAIMIQPYLPSTAIKIRRMLNLPEMVQDGVLKRLQESLIPTGHTILEPKILFTKLNKAEIQDFMRNIINIL